MKIKATKRGFNILNLVLFLSILWSSTAISQVSPRAAGDSTGRPGDVHIIHADRLGFKKMTDSSQIRFASGKVEIRQNTTLFYCDSVAINSVTRIMEAFGHVHINDNDSINIFSDFMRYRGQERTAYLKNNVRLTDGKGTLTTSELDYDLNTKIAVYGKQGKLVSGKSVLTSQAGTYYGDTRDVEFNKNVKLVDPDYIMTTDTLLYNTNTRIATFTVPTLIKKGPYRSIQTTDGYYDLQNKTTYLGKRPTIIDSTSILIADEVAAEDSTGFAEARGNVVFRDTAQGMVILCNDLKSSRENSSFLATINPVAIIKQEKDSIFIAADTLYSARFPDSVLKARDSIAAADSLSAIQGSTKSGAVVSANGRDTTRPAAANDLHPALSPSSADSTAGATYPNAPPVAAHDSIITPANAQNRAGFKSFHKEGKVFVWDKDTAVSPPSGAKSPGEDVKKQTDKVDKKKKGLFGFLKKSKEESLQVKSNAAPKPKAAVKVPLSTDTTRLPHNAAGSNKDSATVKEADLIAPSAHDRNSQDEDTTGRPEKKDKKGGIFGFLKKKDASEGKQQPSIIDSIRTGKRQPVLDSTGRSVKPGIDLSPSRSVGKNDSIRKEDNKSRFLEAYYNVRIFSDSLQGIGDSLYYSAKDSLFQLFKNPTVWTTSNHQISQISGDTINMQTANNKPEYIRVANNAIMISQADTLHSSKTAMFFNQMSGRRMEAWFHEGQLDSLSAEGNAKGIFYLLDEDNKYIGVNQQESRTLNFYFSNRELQRIVGKNDVVGRMYPMQKVDHEKIKLKDFKWLEDKRPKSKYELLAH